MRYSPGICIIFSRPSVSLAAASFTRIFGSSLKPTSKKAFAPNAWSDVTDTVYIHLSVNQELKIIFKVYFCLFIIADIEWDVHGSWRNFLCDHEERNWGSITDIRRRRRSTVHIILISESTCLRFIRATLDSSVAVAPGISQSRRNALRKKERKVWGTLLSFFFTRIRLCITQTNISWCHQRSRLSGNHGKARFEAFLQRGRHHHFKSRGTNLITELIRIIFSNIERSQRIFIDHALLRLTRCWWCQYPESCEPGNLLG